MNSDPLILDPTEVKPCSPALMTSVGKSLIQQCKAIDAAKRLDEIAIDEGVDFFSVQADHDRANAQFLARLNELLADRRGA